MKERIIKSKSRVKNHGEVFTPRKIVRDMINLPGLDKAIRELKTTVLEPACGEGVFLVEILKERLIKVKEQSAGDLTIYENLSLLSLTTLYGIELLEDNAQKCVINIFETFHEDYKNFANSLDKKTKFRVKESAKLIITTNIVEGNFLTKLTNSNKPIVFSEWRVVESKSNCKNIKIDRTEFSLDEIINEEDKDSGSVYEQKIKPFQISFFDLLENNSLEEKEEKEYKYKTVKILDLYKEDMEEITYEYAIDK